MAMKQLFINDSYKVMALSFNKRQSLLMHTATSDACIIINNGHASLVFNDRQVQLSPGITQIIPANEPHRLEVNDDFTACLVLAAKAEIRFV